MVGYDIGATLRARRLRVYAVNKKLSAGGRVSWLTVGHLRFVHSLARTAKSCITLSKAKPGLRPSTRKWRAAHVARLSLVAKRASF